MAKKFNRVSAKKNKQQSKSRFKDSIILSESTNTINNTSEIIADQNEVSVGITSPIEQQNATYSFLSKEIVNIGIITSILLAGLVVTSLIA
ncbi:MAG: hypothetical protein ACJ0G3_01905 [Dehalococcoidia bacterium]